MADARSRRALRLDPEGALLTFELRAGGIGDETGEREERIVRRDVGVRGARRTALVLAADSPPPRPVARASAPLRAPPTRARCRGFAATAASTNVTKRPAIDSRNGGGARRRARPTSNPRRNVEVP